MLKLIKGLLLLLILLLMLLGGTFLWILDTNPVVTALSAKQVNEADSVKPLLTSLRTSFRNRHSMQSITLSEAQLNALLGLAQRAEPKFRGDVRIMAEELQLVATLELPSTPFGQFINLDIRLAPGPGLTFKQLHVGQLPLPANGLLKFLAFVSDWYTQSDFARQLLKQVKHLYLRPNQATLLLLPMEGMLNELNKAKEGLGGEVDEIQVARTAHYLAYLSELPPPATPSLSYYLQALFVEAEKLSFDDTAHLENEAALMAIATFAGHYRFGQLVGNIQPQPGRVARPPVELRLANRTDLSKHFVYSAAIKLLSEQGISAAIGEFKELMDRSTGGSGYSFVDLAADKAGIHFAIQATALDTARGLQKIMAANQGEEHFFPDITGLPEGLSKADFTQSFGQVDSPAYNQVVEEIERRLDQLPLYAFPQRQHQ